MKDYGLLQVYTGSGKGKTTAALGVALRAAGRGAKTVMLSFLKDDPDYGEAMAAQYLPHFLLRQVGRDAFVNFHNPDPIDLKMVRKGWEEAKEKHWYIASRQSKNLLGALTTLDEVDDAIVVVEAVQARFDVGYRSSCSAITAFLQPVAPKYLEKE